jgi:hypothetical protein
MILTNVITSLIIFIFFFYVRTYILPEAFYNTTLIILDYRFDFNINRDFFLGICAVISRLLAKGFVEDILYTFFPEKFTLNAPVAPLSMNMGNSTGQTGGSGDKGNSSSTTLSMNMDNPTGEGSGLKKPYRIVPENKLEAEHADYLLVEHFSQEFRHFKEEMDTVAKRLNTRCMQYGKDIFTLDSPGMPKILVMMLQDQTVFYNISVRRRMA